MRTIIGRKSRYDRQANYATQIPDWRFLNELQKELKG
jgi:hypothetical protein